MLADADANLTVAAVLLKNSAVGNGGALAAFVRATVRFAAGAAAAGNTAGGSGGCAHLGGGPSSIGEPFTAEKIRRYRILAQNRDRLRSAAWQASLNFIKLPAQGPKLPEIRQSYARSWSCPARCSQGCRE